MSEGVPICEVCGWQDAGRRRRPGHCPRCLRIKKMFLAGELRCEIRKRVGMRALELRYVIRRLGLKRPMATCPVCGLEGRLAMHTPGACARKLLVRSLSAAGMRQSAIARKLGVSRNLPHLTTRRLGIEYSRPVVEICSVCGWRGVIPGHPLPHSAYLLRVRQMRVAGLSLRVIARELGFTQTELSDALHRLRLAHKTPE